MLTGLVGNRLETQTDPSGESEGETEPKFGGLIIEDVSGNVEPSQSEEPTAGADISSEETGESESTDEPVDGTLAEDPTTGSDGPEQNSGQTGGSAGKDEPTTTESEEVNVTPQYQTYLVEKGDTLVTICWEIYGYRDDELIDLICEINNLEDKNRIYAGQALLIP